MLTEALTLFLKGGIVMYALLIASVFAVSVAIERYIYFVSQDSGVRFADEVSALLQEGKYGEAQSLCVSSKGANAQIILRALALIKIGPQFIEKHLESEASICVAGLRRRIPYLGIIVTMAPLLGLLGTVVGMISSFNVFSLQAGQPHAITGGVGEALIATASGLCVALIALIAHSYFAQRIDTMLTDMERTFSTLVESLYRSRQS